MTGYHFRTYAADRQQKHNFRITKRAETQKFQLFHTFSITPCLRYLHARIPNRHIQRYACANRVVYTIYGLQQHAIALREIRQPACVLLRCLVVNAEIISAAGYRHRKRADRLTVSQKTVKRLVLHILRQIHIPVIAADRMIECKPILATSASAVFDTEAVCFGTVHPGYSVENSGSGSTVPSLC